MVIWMLLPGNALAEDPALKAQMEKILNLGPGITVEKFQNGDDLIVLWTEPANDGKAGIKNWGLVYYVRSDIADSWFYEGRYTNTFKRFLGSFQQFTGDGRKELALIGEGQDGTGWAHLFVVNLVDRKIKVIYEGESHIQTGILTRLGEGQTAGMFQDINRDKLMEIIAYRELRGTAGKSVYWADLYSWNGKEMTLVNKKYPEYYQKLMGELEKAAAEEEVLPKGNYRIFYEHIALIYDLRNQPKEAAAARERMLLPPLELGKYMQEFLRIQGYRVCQSYRADIDGAAPQDAVVWAKTPDGATNQVWFVAQNSQTIHAPFTLPLPEAFFEPGGEVQFTVKDRQVWAYRKPTAAKPGMGLLYRYDGAARFTLLGTEEREVITGGRVIRRITGETYRDPDLADRNVMVNPTSVIYPVKAQGAITVDGRFMENDWARAPVLNVNQEEQVTRGYDDWNNPTDLSYSIRSLYQGSSLYFGIKVKDEIRVYATGIGVHAGWLSDHIEMYFVQQGKLHRYGIFILPTEAQAYEWVDGEWKAPTYPVRAQWMPGPDGYWVEFEIKGLALNVEILPLTILVFDKDTADGVNPYHDTVMATSAYKADDPETLGLIKFR